jgi:Kef-type K+ transport system membrane component KefB
VEPIQLAAVLAAVVLVASIVSVELGVTAALIELTLGVVVGSVFDLGSAEWLDFVATFASIVLTFLGGMEVDPAYMRRRLSASLGIGFLFLRRALPGCLACLLLPPRLDGEGIAHRRHGAFDHVTGGRLAKMVPKVAFILPLARRAIPKHATFTTLLMSTGLTFGTISSLYGLNAEIIDRTQFSLLVTVVVLSAVVPTAIAEWWFIPDAAEEREADASAPIPAEEYV